MFDAWAARTRAPPEPSTKKKDKAKERLDNALEAATEAFMAVCCPGITTRTLGGPSPPDALLDIWWSAVIASGLNMAGAPSRPGRLWPWSC